MGSPNMATITVSTDVKLPNPRIGGQVLPTIKLTYFNLRARAEPARLLLAYAGVKYEDIRIPAPWDNPSPWASMKPSTPYGQVPLIQWNGEIIAQSMAIARFLAAEFNLKGKNNLESAEIDEI